MNLKIICNSQSNGMFKIRVREFQSLVIPSTHFNSWNMVDTRFFLLSSEEPHYTLIFNMASLNQFIKYKSD